MLTRGRHATATPALHMGAEHSLTDSQTVVPFSSIQCRDVLRHPRPRPASRFPLCFGRVDQWLRAMFALCAANLGRGSNCQRLGTPIKSMTCLILAGENSLCTSRVRHWTFLQRASSAPTGTLHSQPPAPCP